jgi:xylulokinase
MTGPTGPTYLGIDLGTSSVKVSLVDRSGSLGPVVRREYAVESPSPGAAETDVEVWWDAVVGAVRELVTSTPDEVHIGGIGLSGQMHGLVLADARGTAVRPAILWADSRSGEVLDAYAALSDEARLRLANPIVAGMAGPSLLWLQRHEPESVAAARWALQPKDWLRARLTGVVATEPTDASATLLWDCDADCWDLPVADALGIPASLLAPPSETLTSAGVLTAAAAEALGLPSGTPVGYGAGDCAAGLAGTGLGTNGGVQLTLGTGGTVIRMLSAGERTSPALHRYRAAPSGSWYAMAATLNVGLALQWVVRLLNATWPELYAAAALEPSPGDPFFLPQLSGERTPFLSSRMRGRWVDLDLHCDRRTMLRSALEGVAFAVRDMTEHLGGDDGVVRLTGGGTTTPGWRQLICDVLNRPLAPVEAADASVRGASLIGAVAVGAVDVAEIFGALALPVGAATEPNTGRDQYDERFASYRELAVESAERAGT